MNIPVFDVLTIMIVFLQYTEALHYFDNTFFYYLQELIKNEESFRLFIFDFTGIQTTALLDKNGVLFLRFFG